MQSAKITQEKRDQVLALAQDAAISTEEIAARMGCSTTKIRDVLRAAGISRGKAHSGKTNGMYGRTHTPEARAKIRAANQRQFAQEGAREAHALLTCQQIQNGQTGKAYNKPEQRLAAMLDASGIRYTQQYRLGRFLYDFYLVDRATLVEVQGTFWHADPRVYDHARLSAIQQRNVANDAKKAARASQDGLRLVQVWEHDLMASDALPPL